MKSFKVSCVQIASGPNVEANLIEVSKHIEKSKNLALILLFCQKISP